MNTQMQIVAVLREYISLVNCFLIVTDVYIGGDEKNRLILMGNCVALTQLNNKTYARIIGNGFSLNSISRDGQPHGKEQHEDSSGEFPLIVASEGTTDFLHAFTTPIQGLDYDVERFKAIYVQKDNSLHCIYESSEKK